MYWKTSGRKYLWPNFYVVSRYTLGGTEENQEDLQSAYPVSGPRFEPGTSKICIRRIRTLGSCPVVLTSASPATQ
jgi:hypothetical protein